VIWWAKPWLDRTILFVLSRAAFRQPSSPAVLWRAQRDVWWRQLLFTLSIRRLSLWRSFTQPVYQLEGGSIRESGARVRQIRRRRGLRRTRARLRSTGSGPRGRQVVDDERGDREDGAQYEGR